MCGWQFEGALENTVFKDLLDRMSKMFALQTMREKSPGYKLMVVQKT